MTRLPLVICLLLSIGTAQAQRPAAPVSGFNPTVASVKEGELLGGQDKVLGHVSIPDSKAGVLEQPMGKVWRDYRRSWLPWVAGVFVLGMCAALAAFFAWRGRVRLDDGPTGRLVVRFGDFERFMHWVTASSWLVLALSGLNMAVGRRLVLPLIGEDAFSAFSELAKIAHNFIAFPFACGVVLMLLVWARHNIPNAVDIAWFRQFGGLLGHAHPPAEKFNGGQKAVFWIVVLFGSALAATGFVLMFPFAITDVTGMQADQVAHGLLAMAMIAVMLGHIYIGTLGMEGAFDAMGSGKVDEAWAKAHHSLWMEAEAAKARGLAE